MADRINRPFTLFSKAGYSWLMLNQVKEIAKQAGRLILSIYDSAESASSVIKTDGSPLTRADQAAHEHIVSALSKQFPEIPIISEEGSSADWANRQHWPRFFLVDPLDGTKEFLQRNGEFTVNVALIEQHRPVAAVVHVPVSNTTYSAQVGAGAWCETSLREPVRLRTRSRSDGEVLIIVGSRSHGGSQLERFQASLPESVLITRGSSLKLCMIAEGSADLYPRHGPTSLWDIAAGHCILIEAGGFVVNASGAELTYGDHSSLRNQPFLAGGVLDSQTLDSFCSSLIE
jgi:3'(2'), 5'-bisphosphate nucleotidase